MTAALQVAGVTQTLNPKLAASSRGPGGLLRAGVVNRSPAAQSNLNVLDRSLLPRADGAAWLLSGGHSGRCNRLQCSATPAVYSHIHNVQCAGPLSFNRTRLDVETVMHCIYFRFRLIIDCVFVTPCRTRATGWRRMRATAASGPRSRQPRRMHGMRKTGRPPRCFLLVKTEPCVIQPCSQRRAAIHSARP